MARQQQKIITPLVRKFKMKDITIKRPLADSVLMISVYYKHHAPGGMAAVIQYYEGHFEKLHYVASWRLTNVFGRIWYAVTAYLNVFFRLIFDRKIKILHIHTASDMSFWRKSQFVKLGKFFGKKVILHVHASRFKDFYSETTKKELIRKNLLLPDRLIVLSQSWKEWFVGIGIPEKNIVVLHNITDYPKISNDNDCTQSNRPLRFLFMGEIGERKGVFDILRGITNHVDELNGKMVLRIGGNRHEDELRKMISDNHLDDLVKFEGWVSGDKKIELLNWADVFILPSHNEGLPISILEAMSYGMPVISTPVGGIPEVVSEQNGILVTPGNEEEIINAILFFINNPDTISSYGKVSKEIVKTYLPYYVIGHLKFIYE
ncbi:MAG: glycosyltransferase family 4 protein [Prevotella sp.]|nr:glycosyltransferase family 4 protein [Prevotella sp.]